MAEKVKILFLAANPKHTTQLRLDEEIREIQSRIRAADFRDHFELVARWAVRPDDLLQAFNEVRPHIVHFSGHGSQSAELVLEDKDGNPKPVAGTALVALFKHVKDNIRLVVLNACHTDAQAKAISNEIECTIGMNQGIGDEAAVTFASWFYGALAFGRSVGEAFEQGRTALMLNGIPEDTTPVLLMRPDVDAMKIVFIHRTPANPVLPPLAIEILAAAVSGNSPINFIRHDAGVAVVAGAQQFDCNSNLEQAAMLEHAVSTLVQVGWLRQTDDELFHVTHLGYDAARKFQGQAPPAFVAVRNQMPALIAEMRDDLLGDKGQHVREFFVLSRQAVLGGSEKPRFSYYLEDHENLRGKIDVLENYGFVRDVTPGNCPIYRMSEEFVRLVLDGGADVKADVEQPGTK